MRADVGAARGDGVTASGQHRAFAVPGDVIAADGIHSELRPHAAPPSRPVFHGSVAYRGVLPRERIPHWPNDCWQMWLGKGKHFLSFPVRSGELINYVGFVPTNTQTRESWSAPGDPAECQTVFAPETAGARLVADFARPAATVASGGRCECRAHSRSPHRATSRSA